MKILIFFVITFNWDIIFEVNKNLIKFQYKSISNKKDLEDIRIDMCKRGFLYRLEDYLVCIGVLDKETVEIRRMDRRIW